MSEAERELSVWKGALRARDDELTALKNEIAALKVAKNDVSRCIHPIEH